jgi:hypothetical protein
MTELRFIDGPRRGTVLHHEWVAPQVLFGAWTSEGMCEDRYRVVGPNEHWADYKFEGRWLHPSICDDDCDLCTPEDREWKQVEVDDRQGG